MHLYRLNGGRVSVTKVEGVGALTLIVQSKNFGFLEIIMVDIESV